MSRLTLLFALVALVVAPEALGQPRVSRTAAVPAPASGDYDRAAAMVDASGGVVLAVPFGVFLDVSRSVDGERQWRHFTDDDLGAYTTPRLSLATDGDGVALGIAKVKLGDDQSALGLRFGPDGSVRSRTELSVALSADIVSTPGVVGDWKERTYGFLPLNDGDWLAIHAGETRIKEAERDTTGVEVLVASRIAASGAVSWSGGVHVAPTLVTFEPGETASQTVARGPRATLPIDMTAYIGSASQSAILDLDLSTGTASLAPGFEVFGTGYDGARPGTTFFGATPSGRRVRIGLTGTQNTFRDREGTTRTNTEWFIEADGMERVTTLSIGPPDPHVVCDWGDDIAMLSTRWAENYERPLDLQLISADGRIGERQQLASVSVSEEGTYEHRVLACGEVGDVLRVVTSGSYETYGNSVAPPSTVTAYDLTR